MYGERQPSTEFSISYVGEALELHTMEIRDLAPALLALGQSFDRANFLLNGDKSTVNLSVRATRPGSFELGLLLTQIYKEAVGFLSDDLVSSAANLKELLIGGGGAMIGLYALIRKLKGRKSNVIEQHNNKVIIEIDKFRYEAPVDLLSLHGDRPLRDQIEATVRPLTRDGIERIVFSDSSGEIDSVTKDEAKYYDVLVEDGTSVTEIVIPRQRLRIESVTFRPDGKWRLHDGEKSRWYAIHDERFLKDVQDGQVRFGKGDFLICQVLMTQRLGPDGDLKLEHEIQQVLRHLKRNEQMPLGEPPELDA